MLNKRKMMFGSAATAAVGIVGELWLSKDPWNPKLAKIKWEHLTIDGEPWMQCIVSSKTGKSMWGCLPADSQVSHYEYLETFLAREVVRI